MLIHFVDFLEFSTHKIMPCANRGIVVLFSNLDVTSFFSPNSLSRASIAMWTELRTVGIPVLFLIFVGEFLIFHHKILFWLWDFYRCLCLLLEPIVTANFVALYKVWQWNWIHCKKSDSETCILWPSPAQYKRRNAHIDWKNEGRLHGGGGICLVVCW